MTLPTTEVIDVDRLFALVKLVVIGFVVVLLADYVREGPTGRPLLSGLVAAVGPGPGVHNLPLFAIADWDRDPVWATRLPASVCPLLRRVPQSSDPGELPHRRLDLRGHVSYVICAGHVNWDVTLRVDALLEPDGGATAESWVGVGDDSVVNAASGFVSLDVPAALLGSIGDDEHGHAAVIELASKGVDCRYVVNVDGSPITVKYVVVDATGEVLVLGSPGANKVSEVTGPPTDPLAAIDHLHLTNQSPKMTVTFARRTHEEDTTVSFDPGQCAGDRGYAGILHEVDFAFLNDREAVTVLDEATVQRGRDVAVDPVSDVAEVLAQMTLVLKHGPCGAEVRDGNDRHVHPGYLIDAVGTTGTDDTFVSGFIAARLDRVAYERTLTAADVCGTLTAAGSGVRT